MDQETPDQGQESTDSITDQEAPEEQSETTSEEEVKESKLFKLPDGREVTADELFKEHTENLLPEFTKRSQKLSEYQKAEAERETRAEAKATEAVEKSNLLDDVDPNVKEAIGQIAKEQLKAYIKEQEIEHAREEKDREWNSRLDTAERTHDGKDGLPRFSRDVVLKFMMDRDIYDPEIAYSELHKAVIADKMIKEAIKGKGSDTETERTGGTEPHKPAGKTARNFEEAAKNAFARMNNK